MADITLVQIQRRRCHCHHSSHLIVAWPVSYPYFMIPVVPHGSSCVIIASSAINFAPAVICARPFSPLPRLLLAQWEKGLAWQTRWCWALYKLLHWCCCKVAYEHWYTKQITGIGMPKQLPVSGHIILHTVIISQDIWRHIVLLPTMLV